VLQVTSPESGGPISAWSSSSLSIEGVCSELVQALWSRLSRGWVARLRNGHFGATRAMHCLIKTCAVVSYTQTRHRQDEGESEKKYWHIHGG
jgi:hypothetical protein